jgi:FixJ family two-component response regulator
LRWIRRKGATAGLFARFISSVISGKTVMLDIMERVEERLARLTPREREVLNKIMEGLLNKEIAYELGISERTIKAHRRQIMEKMGTKSIVHLTRMCAAFL